MRPVKRSTIGTTRRQAVSFSDVSAQIEKLNADGVLFRLLPMGRVRRGRAGIANNTVHSYIRLIYEKLHVRSRMGAVAKLGGAGFTRGASRGPAVTANVTPARRPN